MKIRHLCLLLLLPSLLYAASFTVSKSMVGSSGSFNTAGFTESPYTWTMTNSIVAGFSANVTTTKVQLANGGLTNLFCGGFILRNNDTNWVVNLFLNSSGTQTQAVIQPGHSVCIDGAPASLWVNTQTNTALISWAFTDS